MQQQAVKHVAFFLYPVRNLARAQQFYEGTLGLKQTQTFDGHWVEYAIQDVTLALTDWLEDINPHHNGGGLALEVANAASTLQFLADNQVTILKDLFETPLATMGIVADPDGNSIIIHQSKGVV